MDIYIYIYIYCTQKRIQVLQKPTKLPGKKPTDQSTESFRVAENTNMSLTSIQILQFTGFCDRKGSKLYKKAPDQQHTYPQMHLLFPSAEEAIYVSVRFTWLRLMQWPVQPRIQLFDSYFVSPH